VAVEGRELRILREGDTGKFVPAVEQVTFSGELAQRRGQQVLYVTERAVFRLVAGGLELIEVAPGVDLERDILALIPFPVRVARPRPMNARLFGARPMGLARWLGAAAGRGVVERLGRPPAADPAWPDPSQSGRAAS